MAEFSLDWISRIDGLLQPSDLPDSAQLQLSQKTAVRQASVMVPLFWRQEAWHLLFIRRVQNTRDRHSGQVAFPGGRRDPSDKDDVAVAVREAHEEIGLEPDRVEVLGRLGKYHTSSGYDVTPVVAVVPWPYSYIAQQTEVDRIFSIPLAWLADQNNVELRDRQFNVSEARTRLELKVVYFDHYDDELLWGATARMTLSFLKALHDNQIILPTQA